jgi:hypothetical protein
LNGVMQLDMIGFDTRRSEESLFFVTNHTDPGLVRFAKEVARKHLGGGVLLHDTTLPTRFNSGHFSWSARGYSSVFPFESAAEEIVEGRIHSNNDRIGQLNSRHAELFLRLAGAFVFEMAIE